MGQERVIIYQDWITLIFALCLLLIAIAKIVSRVPISELISAYLSDRFVNVTRTDGEGFSILKNTNLVLYALNAALLIYAFVTTLSIKPAVLNTYLLCLLAVSVYLLLKHYFGKLIASILGFEVVLDVIDFHRNVYRSMFSYFLLITTILLFTVFKMTYLATMLLMGLTVFVLIAYHIMLLYTYRQLLIRQLFYFILYLCTLEIVPYLLLYKYFRNIAS